MTRRAVTLFVGLRHLVEASAIEPAKVLLRTMFETLLAVRYIIHGGKRGVTPSTRSDARRRESRARYYLVSAQRQAVYRRQAMLDGRWGSHRVTGDERKRLTAEITSEIGRLRVQFPAQSNAFGEYACYPGSPRKRKRYYDGRKWYSFGFPRATVNTVRALADRLGWSGEYELLYASFSSLTHPVGITHDGTVENHGFETYHPYIPDAFDLVVYWGCRWQELILAYLASVHTPESVPDWQAVDAAISPALGSLKSAIPDGFF